MSRRQEPKVDPEVVRRIEVRKAALPDVADPESFGYGRTIVDIVRHLR